jgi:hypothetical protein
MWRLRNVILRGTGRGSRLHFIHDLWSIGTSNVLICGFGERHCVEGRLSLFHISEEKGILS